MQLGRTRVIFCAALAVAAVVAASLGVILRPAAQAASTGPTIDVGYAGDPVITTGTPIDLTFATTTTSSSPYSGYQVQISYDSSKVRISNNGPADDSTSGASPLWQTDSCNASWDQPLAPPIRTMTLNCQGSASTSAAGALGHVHFDTIAGGSATFTLQSNSGGTFTLDDGAPAAAQTNALTCNGEAQSDTCTITVNITPPDIALALAASDPQPADGAPEDIAFTVHNPSITAATNVVVTLTFPTGLTPDATQPADCVVAGQTVTCTDPNPVIVTNYQLTVTSTAAWTGVSDPTVAVTGQVTLLEADPDLTNNSANVTVNNGAAVDVQETPPNRLTFYPDLVPGDPVRYAVVVTNPSATLSVNVTVVVTLPTELIPFEGQALSPGTCSVSGQTITCTSPLAANSALTFTFVGSVDAANPPLSVPGGVCANVTGDRPDPDLTNNSGCDGVGPIGVVADTDGDGYSDAQETSMGKNPNVYCAIMRADLNHDGFTSIIDFTVLMIVPGISQGTTTPVPPGPGRFDQFDLQPSNGALGPDHVLNQADIDLITKFSTKNVSACP